MSEIVQLYTDEKNTIKAYPKAVASEVYMQDGESTLLDKINNVDNNIDTVKEQLETITQQQATDLSLNGTTLKLKKADGTEIGTGVELPTSGGTVEEHTHSNKVVLDNITQNKINNYDSAYNHSTSTHAPSNAQANVQSDWNATSGDAFIKNKPIIPTVDVTKEYVDTELTKKAASNHTHTKSQITDLPIDIATEGYVKNKIAEAQLGGGEIDLSGYATKDELKLKANKTEIPTKTSQLTNDSGYLTSIPIEYVTETELNSKGYLTQHQDISGKVDKVPGKSLIADTEITRLANVVNYDDTEIISLLATKVSKEYVDNQISNIEIPSGVSKEYVDSQMSSKADNSDDTRLTTDKTVTGAINELFTNVSDGKSSIATAITDKGVEASNTDTFTQLATKIGQISAGVKFASGTFKTTPTSTTFVALPFTPSFVLITVESTSMFLNWVLAREDFFHQYKAIVKDFGVNTASWDSNIQRDMGGGISDGGFKFYSDFGSSTTIKYIAYE